MLTIRCTAVAVRVARLASPWHAVRCISSMPPGARGSISSVLEGGDDEPQQPQAPAAAEPGGGHTPRPARQAPRIHVADEFKQVLAHLPPEPVANPRALDVAVVGAPNAGKSTLVNRLVGTKVSAVSRKYNTTRDRVMGVSTRGTTQIVFTDTPGFLAQSQAKSGRYVSTLVTAATQAVPTADVVLFVVDAARRWDEEQSASLASMAALCAQAGAHLFLVPNKIDLLKGQRISQQTLAAMREALAGTATTPAEASPVAAAVPAAPTAPAGTSAADLWALPASPSPADSVDAAGAAAADTATATAAAPSPAVAHPLAPPASMLTKHAARALRRSKRDLLDAAAVKLDFLLDAFEMACYRAGIVAASGFDKVTPSANNTKTAGKSDASKQAPSVYQFFQPSFPIAAESGDGVTALADALQALALPKPWRYSRTVQTDASFADRLCECVREQLLHHLHDEVPYRCRVTPRSIVRNAAGAVVANVDVTVPSRRVADMLHTRGNGPLKAITLRAIRDAEALVHAKVHLFLHVAVKAGPAGDRAAATAAAGGSA